MLMKDMPTIYLAQLQARLSGVARELRRLEPACVESARQWTPAINAYCCGDRLVICVELAGVDKTSINLRVDSQRLVLRGCRASIQPDPCEHPPREVLALEIDEGPFARELILPHAVKPGEVTAEQRNGLLWIFLPLTDTA